MLDLNFVARLPNKAIECKAFTLKEYISLLEARLNGDSSYKQAFVDMINKCTNAENLPKHEAELLIVILMAKSLNDSPIKSTHSCACGHSQEIVLDYSQTQIVFPKDVPAITELYGFPRFKIKFEYPNIFDDDNVPLMVAKCIKSIHVADNVLSVDDLNDKEIDDLYTAITADDVIKIKKILTGPYLQLATPVKCEKCGKTEPHVISGFKNLIKEL